MFTSVHKFLPKNARFRFRHDTEQEKYGIPVGFSDHSGDINSGLTSLALNANVLEVHVVNTKKSKGFDTSSSIT